MRRMSTGAQGAEAQPHDGDIEWLGEKPWEAAADPDAYPGNGYEEAPGRGLGGRLFAGLLILLALGWLGAASYVLSRAWPGPDLAAWIGWAATISAPLILLGLLWLIFGRSSRRETRRFTAAVRAMRASRPYLDPERVASWGWSGGGSMTLNLLFRSPDLYKVGMSVAPVPDQTLYDTIYQERYMGLPAQNAEGYRKGSPIFFAEGLRGKLLLVHGSGDDNVHYQGSERLINRLVVLGKPFDFMVYPNRTHSINEGEGTSYHLHALLARHLRENLRAGPR